MTIGLIMNMDKKQKITKNKNGVSKTKRRSDSYGQ